MSRTANTAMIGGFVVGGFALVVVAILVLGGGRFFANRVQAVAFFDGSLGGLRVGANATFRGVRIGQVVEIPVLLNPEEATFKVPVVIEFSPDSIQPMEGMANDYGDDDEELLRDLIQNGMRAQLQLDSFVTGQLSIQLGFFPDAPIVSRGNYRNLQELPTIPAGIDVFMDEMQEFLATLKDLPIDELVAHATSAVAGFDKAVNSPEFANTVSGIDRLVNSPEMQQLASRLDETLLNFTEMSKSMDQLATDLNEGVGPQGTDLRAVLVDFSTAIREVQVVLESLRQNMDDDTGVLYQVSATLRETEAAARSFRVLTDYLERHPEALLQGKPSD